MLKVHTWHGDGEGREREREREREWKGSGVINTLTSRAKPSRCTIGIVALTHLHYALTFLVSNLGGLFVRMARMVTTFLSAALPTALPTAAFLPLLLPPSLLPDVNGSQSETPWWEEAEARGIAPLKSPLMVSMVDDSRPRLRSRNCAANRF